jgi:transposase-like protein
MALKCPDCGRILTPILKIYHNPPEQDFVCNHCNIKFTQKKSKVKAQKKQAKKITEWI